MRTDIDKLQSRWIRWLGGITREDKHCWGVLMLSNFIGWAYKINKGEYPGLMSKKESREYFKKAIKDADFENLRNLDVLWTNYKNNF